ncbi:glycosyltransferase family 2 protein [Inquilinus sp. KBS0705]|nr:glycosyltransferase family 2 protein [Inquilinus sp. KBS0705]
MPTFTVIITTYKRPSLLQRAINSVIVQSCNDFECIIINDEPGDNEVIQGMMNNLADSRFTLIKATANKGGNYCRNLGIEKAKGSYVAFLDDDDIWLPQKLEKHLKVHMDSCAHLVFSEYIERWDDNSKPDRLVYGAREAKDIVAAMLKGKFSIGTTSSVTIQKACIKQKLFDENLISFQDWDAWISIAIKQKDIIFTKIHQPLLYFVQHGADRTSTDIVKRRKGLEQILKKYSKFEHIKIFYVNELLNIEVLKANNIEANSFFKKAYLLGKFFLYPPFWINLYSLKRTGKFIFKDK